MSNLFTMRNVFKCSLATIVAIGLSGCGEKFNSSLTPPKRNYTSIHVVDSFTFNVKKGQTFEQIVSMIKKKNPSANIIVKLTPEDKNVSIPINLNNVTIGEVVSLIKKIHNRNITVKPLSENIVSIESSKKEKMSYADTKSFMSDFEKRFSQIENVSILDKDLIIKGGYNIKDIIYLLSKEGVRLHFKLSEKGKKAYSKINSAEASSNISIDNSGKIRIAAERSPANTASGSDLPMRLFFKRFHGTIKDFIKDLVISNDLFIIDVQKRKKGVDIYLADKIEVEYRLALLPINVQTAKYFKDILSQEVNPYKEFEAQLKSMLKDHAVFNLNKSNGVLSVYGDEYAISLVNGMVKEFNKIYGKNIKIEIHIYETELNDENAAGVDIANLATRITKNWHWNPIAAFESTLATNVNSGSGGITFKLQQQYSSGNNIDSVMLKALSQFGKTKIVTRPILETINNIPVVMDFANEMDYVKSIDERSVTQTTQTAPVTTQDINIQTDTFKSGFTMAVLPKIEPNGKIKVIIRPKITKLVGLIPYRYGNQNNPKMIQLKSSNTKDIIQIIEIEEGDIAVVGGYIFNKIDFSNNKIPGTDNVSYPFNFLTSSRQKKGSKSELIFTIRATME